MWPLTASTLGSLALRRELQLVESSVRSEPIGQDGRGRAPPSLELAHACFETLSDLSRDSGLASHRQLLELLVDRLARIAFDAPNS